MSQPDLIKKTRAAAAFKRLAPSTQKTYLGWIERYAGFMAANPDATHCRADVEAFLNSSYVPDSTRNLAVSTLRFLYREVLRIDLGTVSNLRTNRASRRSPVVLCHADAMRVIDHLAGDHRLIAQLLYGSGLRLREVLRLRVRDVDFKRMQIAACDDGSPARVTILPRLLIGPLKARIEQRRRLYKSDLAAGLAGTSDHFRDVFIFTGRRIGRTDRNPILPANTQRAIIQAARGLVIDVRISPHTLRDSFIARLLEQGVALHRVKELVGHESIETTATFLTDKAGDQPITSPLDD